MLTVSLYQKFCSDACVYPTNDCLCAVLAFSVVQVDFVFVRDWWLEIRWA